MKQIFALFILIVCTAGNNICMTKNNTSFDYEGHRGCRGLMPENTIPAMLTALDLKVSTLEMDLHITKDSQVILSHDHWFNPDITTKPDGSFTEPHDTSYILYQMIYDSISKFDVGRKSYDKFPQQKKMHVTKPLLQDLIDSVQQYCSIHKQTVAYNMEIKSSVEGDEIYHPKVEKYVDLVMAVLQKKNIQQDVIIQSFDMRPLQYLHQKYPYMRTSFLIENNEKRPVSKLVKSLGFVPTIISPEYTLVTTKFVSDCHQQHIQVIPWTVNNVDDMKKLKALQVDGLISDYLNLYIEIR